MRDTKARPRAGDRTGHLYAGHDPRVKLRKIPGVEERGIRTHWVATAEGSFPTGLGFSADDAEENLLAQLDSERSLKFGDEPTGNYSQGGPTTGIDEKPGFAIAKVISS